VSAFTRLGSGLWDWEPWTERSLAGRMLWLGLYTSSEAKRHVPGLWQGGLASMADAARMRPDDVRDSLDELLEHELVEYDPKTRVLRLCVLPDAGEYPSNGRVIRSWWTRFQTVPACQVRDAHVRTLAWILDAGTQASGKRKSDDHTNTWAETFGRIVVPAQRRRGLRRLADSDTGTQVQPSLFPTARSSTQELVEAVDNSAALHQMNKIRVPETVSDTVSDTNRIPDPGSRIPEFFSSPERGAGTVHDTGKPALALVYSVEDVLAVLRTGRWDPMFEDTHQDAIASRLASWASTGVTLDDFRVLAQYSRVFDNVKNARWLATCDLPATVLHAKSELRRRDEKLAMLAEFK